MVGRAYDLHGRKVPAIPDYYFAREKYYYYTTGQVKYKCGHPNPNATELNVLWDIWKFVYEDGVLEAKEGPLNGPVNSEALINALAWNI